MIGIYFSGTGNTKYCVTRFVKKIEENAKIYALEDEGSLNAIKNCNALVFGYPVYYSNLPKVVRDFILSNANYFKDKQIFIIATMGLFSGDGAGCAARLFKKCGASVVGALHLKMPDCIGDVKLLKKTLEKNRELVKRADKKIDDTAVKFTKRIYSKNGLNFFCRIAGLFGQRLYFPNKTKHYYTKIKVDSSKCVRCGLCAKSCPMQNIDINDSLHFKDRCIMCYRCFSLCPNQAITILGKQVFEQCKIENYL